MGDVCLTLLGPPEVCHADQVLLFSTRKQLALLLSQVVEGRLQLRKQLGSCAMCVKRLDPAKGGEGMHLWAVRRVGKKRMKGYAQKRLSWERPPRRGCVRIENRRINKACWALLARHPSVCERLCAKASGAIVS